MKRVFLFFIMTFYLSSCGANTKAFICKTKDDKYSISVSYNPAMVMLSDLHTFYTAKAIQREFKSDDTGGTHTFKLNKQQMVLEYIQDTIYSTNKLPSGKWIEDETKLRDKHSFVNRLNYYAQWPMIYRYTLDHKTLHLKYETFRTLDPRVTVATQFSADDYYPNGQPKAKPQGRPMTQEEIKQAFPKKKIIHIDYYCERESPFSLMRILRIILSPILFI